MRNTDPQYVHTHTDPDYDKNKHPNARYAKSLEVYTGPEREKYIVPIDEKDLGLTERNALARTENGIRILKGDNPPTQVDIQKEFNDERVQYSRLRARQERASLALAAGASRKIAAKYAGVSSRMIGEYMSHREFRIRVEEQRTQLMGQIQGRILMEFMRRTDPSMIKSMETGDLAKIFDRTVGKAIGQADLKSDQMQPSAPGEVRYERIYQQIVSIDASSQSIDFPEFEPANVRLPAGSSPLDE